MPPPTPPQANIPLSSPRRIKTIIIAIAAVVLFTASASGSVYAFTHTTPVAITDKDQCELNAYVTYLAHSHTTGYSRSQDDSSRRIDTALQSIYNPVDMKCEGYLPERPELNANNTTNLEAVDALSRHYYDKKVTEEEARNYYGLPNRTIDVTYANGEFSLDSSKERFEPQPSFAVVSSLEKNLFGRYKATYTLYSIMSHHDADDHFSTYITHGKEIGETTLLKQIGTGSLSFSYTNVEHKDRKLYSFAYTQTPEQNPESIPLDDTSTQAISAWMNTYFSPLYFSTWNPYAKDEASTDIVLVGCYTYMKENGYFNNPERVIPIPLNEMNVLLEQKTGKTLTEDDIRDFIKTINSYGYETGLNYSNGVFYFDRFLLPMDAAEMRNPTRIDKIREGRLRVFATEYAQGTNAETHHYLYDISYTGSNPLDVNTWTMRGSVECDPSFCNS